MGMFRKVAAVVNADQWYPPDPDSKASMTEDCLGVLYAGEDNDGPFGKLQTSQGRVIVCPGDWIIRTSDGHNFILNDKDFGERYEAVQVSQPSDLINRSEAADTMERIAERVRLGMFGDDQVDRTEIINEVANDLI